MLVSSATAMDMIYRLFQIMQFVDERCAFTSQSNLTHDFHLADDKMAIKIP